MSGEKVKLGELVSTKKGKKHTEVDDSLANRYIQVEDLNGYYTPKFTNDKGVEVVSNDVIIAWDGANAGKVGTNLKGIIGSTLARLRPLTNNVNGTFLFRFLQSKESEIKSKRTGATIPHVNGPELKNLIIPLPPLTIQQKIAAILDQADALRKKDQQLLAKYDELLQSVFYDMFGDPVKNEKGWPQDIVIRFCDCIVPGRDKPKSFSGDIPWITTDDLNFLGTTTASKKRIGLTKDEISEVRARIIPKDSVIMTCVGDLGIISIAGSDIVVNQQLHAFQTNEKLNNIFLMFMLSKRKDYMLRMATSTTLPYMNKTICNSIPILLPPINLQNQFAKIAQNIQQQKQSIKQQMEQSENLFLSLLQRAFKGDLVKE